MSSTMAYERGLGPNVQRSPKSCRFSGYIRALQIYNLYGLLWINNDAAKPASPQLRPGRKVTSWNLVPLQEVRHFLLNFTSIHNNLYKLSIRRVLISTFNNILITSKFFGISYVWCVIWVPWLIWWITWPDFTMEASQLYVSVMLNAWGRHASTPRVTDTQRCHIWLDAWEQDTRASQVWLYC